MEDNEAIKNTLQELNRKYKRQVLKLTKQAFNCDNEADEIKCYKDIINLTIKGLNEQDEKKFTMVNCYIRQNEITDTIRKLYPNKDKKNYRYYNDILTYMSLTKESNSEYIQIMENVFFKLSTIISLWILSEYNTDNKILKDNSLDRFLTDSLLQERLSEIILNIESDYTYYATKHIICDYLIELNNIEEKIKYNEDIKDSTGYHHLKDMFTLLTENKSINENKTKKLYDIEVIQKLENIVCFDELQAPKIREKVENSLKDLRTKKGYIEFYEVLQKLANNY